MTWKSSDPAVAAVGPRMLDEIDPGTAEIIATTTDGGHTATCEVRVAPARTLSPNLSLNLLLPPCRGKIK
jgi:uncharacterized protein YjdB